MNYNKIKKYNFINTASNSILNTMNIKSQLRYLFVAFLIGFVSLVYEVYSLKVVFLYVTENTHAVSITLAAFLSGLAFASLYFSRKTQKDPQKNEQLLLVLQIVSGIYGAFVLSNSSLVPSLLGILTLHADQGGFIFIVIKFALIFIYLFIPAFLLGGSFPILNGLYQNSYESRYHDTGKVYFWDTTGSITGSLIAGFVLIPLLGLEKTILIPLIVTGIASVILISKVKKKVISAILFALIIGTFIGTHHKKINEEIEYIPYDERFGEVLFQKNSEYGVGNNRREKR